MKYILQKALGLLLFFFGFLVIYYGLRYAMVNDSPTFHEFYNQKNMDVLFVGSSHCMDTIDPAIMDRELNLSTFNGGMAGQYLDGYLLVIQEAAKKYNVKQVYLEMFYGMGGYTRHDERSIKTKFSISAYIKPSISKYLYMLRLTNSEHYIFSFFPMRWEWKTLYDLDQIQQTLKLKCQDNYLMPHIDNTSEAYQYAGKGFYISSTQIKNWNYFGNADHVYYCPINYESYTNGDWVKDLERIIKFCKNNNIELTLFSVPVPDNLLVSTNNYDDYITIVRSLIKETGIPYWDFNLCKEVYFPNDSALFKDDNHLNAKGAEIFSTLFARFIKGEISPEELFYSSYEEKLRHLPPNIFGVTYRIKNGEAGKKFRSCRIIATPTEGIEYQITIHPADGEPYQIQDYWWNTVFPLPYKGAGKIIIRWRIKGMPEYTGERIIDFPK